MQQPDGPRHGGQSVSTQASQENDGISTSQVPTHQRVNSEYLESNDYYNHHDNEDYESGENNNENYTDYDSHDQNEFSDNLYEGDEYDSEYYANYNKNIHDNTCRENTHAPNDNQGYENYDSYYDQPNSSHSKDQLYDKNIKTSKM